MKRKKISILDEMVALLGHKRPTKSEASHAGFILSRRARSGRKRK
jgi:hypothetical protein